MSTFQPPENPALSGVTSLWDALGQPWSWNPDTERWMTPVGADRYLSRTWDELITDWFPLTDDPMALPDVNKGRIARVQILIMDTTNENRAPVVVASFIGFLERPASVRFAQNAADQIMTTLGQRFPNRTFVRVTNHQSR